MADSLPDTRGGEEAGTAGVVGAKTDGPPTVPCGEDVQQQQQEKEEAVLNQATVAANSSGQQNECGGTSGHPAGAESVVPAGKGGEDTDVVQNECGGVSVCPKEIESVLPTVKERVDTGSLLVVQNDSESSYSESSKTQGGLNSSESKLATAGKANEDTSNPVVIQSNSESACSEPSKAQSELIQGSDDSKLEKVSVSQAKDPPDRDSFHVTQEAAVTGAGELPASVAAMSVSTKPLESQLTPDSTISLPDPEQPASGSPTLEEPALPEAAPSTISLPGPEQPAPGSPALEQPAPGSPALEQPALPEAAPSMEGISEESALPAVCGSAPAGDCQSAVKDSLQPHSVATEQPPSLGSESLSSASGGAPLEPQASLSANVPLLAAGAEGSSSQSSQLSSLTLGSDSCSAMGVGVFSTSALQEVGATEGVSVNQSEGGESGPQVPVSEGPFIEECMSVEGERQADATSGGDCVMTEGEGNESESQVADMLENMTSQSDTAVELNDNWNGRNFTCEAGTETDTLPLIVATRSLSHEQNAEKEANEMAEAAAAADAMSSRQAVLPLPDTEPLRPVTIGSSLQPLEEVQEATAAEVVSSFAADLAIIDSSADEADSIGGLVINNVIGAADGVVDFQPDEVETEKELMDISSSAPQLSDTTEEPSAKRRRLENGLSDSEDRVDESKRVILKIIPVKNGHGLWDSQKLQEVLLAKGTILLQIHASRESLELSEADKTDGDKKVDFSAIMIAAKDDDQDPPLACGGGSGGVDPECDDPLAIVSSPAETTTHLTYARSLPPPRGRSTALQPAMPPRPTFKHLQTPQHYYMKNEVLGLPPPLEFEEPQGGSVDMSGVGAKSTSTTTIRHVYLGLSSMDRTKECKVCGVNYWYPKEERLHLHNEMHKCDKCPFASMNPQAYTKHIMTHTKQQRCTVCFETFDSPITIAVHKRKIHGLYECKYCAAELPSRAEWSNHVRVKHRDNVTGNSEERVAQIRVNTSERVPSSGQSPDTYESHLRTILTEAKQPSPLRVIRHHAVPSKEFVTNLTQASNGSSSSPKQLLVRNMAMIAPSSSAGMIISNNEAVSIIKSCSVQALSSLTPQPLPYFAKNTNFDINTSGSSAGVAGNQAPFSPSPSIIEGISLKEEPFKEEPTEEENAKPDTVLIKVKPKRRRGPISNHMMKLPCDSCSDVFKNLTALRIHIKQKHTVKPKCPLCHITKPSARKVYQHQATVHKDKLRCHHYCLELFDTREELSAHHINVHNKDDTVMKCRYCRESYPRGTYLKHLENCTGEIRNKLIKHCSCGKKFTDSTEYMEHVEHCDPADVEEDCGEESPSTSAVEDKDSTLPKCEKEIAPDTPEESSSVVLRKSSSITSEGKILKCRGCRRIFNDEGKGIDHVIKQHKAALSYVKEYKICDVCGKLFILGLSLCKHLLEHYERDGMWDKILPSQFFVEYIKVKCWVCKTQGLSYSEYHIENRNAAIDRIFSSKAYKGSVTKESDSSYCSLCEENFSNKQVFWKHIKIHLTKSLASPTEESHHVFCPKCDYKCNARAELLEHVTVHFVQKVEDETGDNKSALTDDGSSCNAEMQDESHGNEILECSLCQISFNIRSFALSHVLNNHRRVLEETITFKNCPMCDKQFFKPLSLCSHILNHYTDLGMWEEMVPRDLLSQVTIESDKKFCWVCKYNFSQRSPQHQARRNDQIEKILSTISDELEEECQFQCPLCEFSCSNRYNHWKHVKLHLYLNRKSIGKVDPEPEQELLLNTENSERKKFDCLRCNKQFYGIEELRRHLAKHFLKPYRPKKRKALDPVEESKKLKKVKTMTLRRKSSRSKSSTVRCVSCDKTFRYSTDAMTHVLAVHKDKAAGLRVNDLQCTLCNVVFKSEWWLCRHVLNHYSGMESWDALVPRDLASKLNERNKCWVCKCLLNKNYTAHTSKRNSYISVLLASKCKQKEIPFDCSLCNQEFPTRVQYWQHMMLHLCTPPVEYNPEFESVGRKKGEIKCNYCSVLFPDENALDEHLALHFLEYEDEMESESMLTSGNQPSEDDVAHTGDSSSSSEDDEWLPPSQLKKKLQELKDKEDTKESNNSEDNEENLKIAVVGDIVSVDLTED